MEFLPPYFNSLFLLTTRHSSVFQIISWNWEHLINRKMKAKKVFWHRILHSYLYNALRKFFLSKSKATNVFPKHILKSEACDKSVQARKKLFCHVIVKNYLWNVLYKFLIKIKSTWRPEIKEQVPQLTLLFILYCTAVGPSEVVMGGIL